MKKSKGKANRGITLIALVITIIVLLILAAVSIATLTGENGVLTKANEAKRITQEEGIKEEIKIAYVSVETEGIMKGWDINQKAKELQKELRKEDKTATVTVDGTSLKVSYKGVELIINENGQIEIAGNSKITINEFSIKGTKVTSITPPAGFVHVGGTIDTGYVISDDPLDEGKGDGHEVELLGNQFVWIPVEKDQKITATVTSEENIESLVITDPYGDDIIKESNIGKQYNEQIEPTINGPYRLTVTTEGGEEKKEFLNVHSLYAVDTFNDWQANEEYAVALGYGSLPELLAAKKCTTVEELLLYGKWTKEHSETENYQEKVNANGGFYIGRYEAGDSSAPEEGRSVSSVGTGTLVTKKNQFVYNYINQIDALSKAQSYNETLSSSLLTGAAWDRVLGWLYETEAKTASELAIDSTSWENHWNDTFSNAELIKTGQFSQTKANNIYDLAGNVREWTSEAYYLSGYRVSRGAYYNYHGTNFPIANRFDEPPNNCQYLYGFRLALYL